MALIDADRIISSLIDLLYMRKYSLVVHATIFRSSILWILGEIKRILFPNGLARLYSGEH